MIVKVHILSKVLLISMLCALKTDMNKKSHCVRHREQDNMGQDNGLCIF